MECSEELTNQTLPDFELAKPGKETSGARATAPDQSGLSSASPLLTTSTHQGQEMVTDIDENKCIKLTKTLPTVGRLVQLTRLK